MIDAKVYTLLKVVETGNYSQAAKALNITQPAVSQHMRALETELGVKVFERVGNQLVLTKEGEKAVELSRTLVALYNKLRNEIKDVESGTTTLRIGITHTVESNRITEALAQYASSTPSLSIQLIASSLPKLKEKLKNYEIDFAIMDGRVVDESIESVQLDVDNLVLITSIDHPLTKKEKVTTKDIEKEKLILRLPNSGTRDLFTASLESQNLSIDHFNVILEVDNIATIKDLVRHEYGVSVLAKSACASEIRKKTLAALPIENLSMFREISIVYPKSFNHPELFDEIKRIYREM